MNPTNISKDSCEEAESPDPQEVDDTSTSPDSNSNNVLCIENKFRNLESKARKFELTVMQYIEKQERIERHSSKILKKRAFQEFSEKHVSPDKFNNSKSLSLNSPFVSSGYIDLIQFLTKFYSNYLNGLILVICEKNLENQLETQPFDSLLVKCACAIAFPIVMNVLGKTNYLLQSNYFYLDLKNSLVKSFNTPQVITLWGMTACLYLEIGHGDPTAISTTIVKGTRLLELVGLTEDIPLEELSKGDKMVLSKSLLWNFWANCISLDTTYKYKFKNTEHLQNFSAQHFEQLNLVSGKRQDKNEETCLKMLMIFNYQVFRQITLLQKNLMDPTKNKEQLFDLGVSILIKIILAYSSIKDWVEALCKKDRRIFSDKFFFCKVTIVLPYFSQYILLINALLILPKELSQKMKNIPNLPCTIEFSETALLILEMVENHGQLIFAKKDSCFIHSFTMAYSITYYYIALFLIDNFTNKGSQIFYQCLEKLRRIAPIWNVIHDWVIMLVKKRKIPTLQNSPPLAFDRTEI